MALVEGSNEIITGSLGGGKSMCAVERIMEHLSRGGTVVTNIECHWQENPKEPEKTIEKWLEREYLLKYDPERVKTIGQESIKGFENMGIRGSEEMTVLMVLDEAALDVNAHDWKSQDRGMLNFIVLLRKLKIDLVFIAQNASDIDKQVRLKFQRETHCREVLKMLRDWLGIPIPGKLFVRVPYILTVGAKPWRQRAKFSLGSPAMGYYNSHALHGSKAKEFKALAEAKTGKLQRIKRPSWPWYIVAAAIAITTCNTTLWLIVASSYSVSPLFVWVSSPLWLLCSTWPLILVTGCLVLHLLWSLSKRLLYLLIAATKKRTSKAKNLSKPQ